MLLKSNKNQLKKKEEKNNNNNGFLAHEKRLSKSFLLFYSFQWWRFIHFLRIQMQTVYCCLLSSFFFLLSVELTSNQNLPNNRSTHSKCIPYPFELLFTSRDVCILNILFWTCRPFFSPYLLFFSLYLLLFLAVYAFIYDARLVVNVNSNFSYKACFNPFSISAVKWTAKRYWWINSWFCCVCFFFSLFTLSLISTHACR